MLLQKSSTSSIFPGQVPFCNTSSRQETGLMFSDCIPETMSPVRASFNGTTCKHRKGVIHTNNVEDNDSGGQHHSQFSQYNLQISEKCDQKTEMKCDEEEQEVDLLVKRRRKILLYNERVLGEQTRSSIRVYRKNNKLGFAGKEQVAPEDLDDEGGNYYWDSTTTASSSSNPYLLEGKNYWAAASPTKKKTSSVGRFSGRKLNIFQMSSLFSLLLFSMSLAGVSGVRINSLSVPETVRNGTEETVILDCDYSVEEAEKKGLVVKWFHKQKQSPVYQWIPSTRPIGMGILKGKLNLDYVADHDEIKLHRALQIIRPTIELSGDWICEVSTFEGEAYKAARMIIFAPEKDMGIHVSENRRDGRVNVSCWAVNVFPEPRLMLFREDQMVDDLVQTTKLVRGTYDVSAYKIIEDANLSSLASTYECELTIPNTDYVRRQAKLYEPGSLELRDEMAMGGTGPSAVQFISVSAGFYFWVVLIVTFTTFSMTSAEVLLHDVASSPTLSLLFFFL